MMRQLCRCCDCKYLCPESSGPAGCEAPRPWWAEKKEETLNLLWTADVLESHYCDMFEPREAGDVQS